jgi:hypothetical protein
MVTRPKGYDGRAAPGMKRASPMTNENIELESLGMPAADFGLSRTLVLPCECDVALTAFPQAVRAFADEIAFRAAQEGPLAYAPESFVPSGLSAAALSGVEPSCVARFSGRVESVSSFDNAWTGLSLPWVTVRTLGLTIDMPVAPWRLTGELVEKGIVSVTAAIYGKIEP